MKVPAHGVWLVGAVVAVASLAGCSGDLTGPPPPSRLLVSNPVHQVRLAAAAPLRAGAPDSLGAKVVYVSLLPGAVPTGSIATIHRVGDAGLTYTTVRDGGFDPVAIEAQADDSVEILVTDAAGATVLKEVIAVSAVRRPVVVRTEPPPQKRDVPLNATIVVVFSEPVAEATVSASSVQLLRGTSAIAGTVRLLEGTGSVAAFTPAAELQPNTDYTLVVTTAITDLDGDALEAGVTVPFTTGQSSAGPPASVIVLPDTLYMTGGMYQLTVTVRDAAGNVLIDQPVSWSSSDLGGLGVSQTGLVTALATGSYTVTASVNDITGAALVIVLAGPPASVTLSPANDTVGAAGDTIILTATVRDARARVIRYPSVTWTSSAPAVATVASYNPGDVGPGLATVTGVSLGEATITATSGTASGAATVTVVPPAPVDSVAVTPDSTSVLIRFTRRFAAVVRDSNGNILAGRAVTWTTGNPAVATVDASGLVTGVGAGTSTVIATSEGVSDSAVITVVVIDLNAVSAGAFHGCGLTTSGAAHCWGFNDYGQLGDGSFVSRLLPTAVSGGLTFSQISASSFHTCGVTLNGAAYCWGGNGRGQLGDGSTTSSPVPVAVSGGLTFSSVSAGRAHSCGLTTSGAAYCWGLNDSGQLGDSATGTNSSIPVAVAGGLAFSAVSVGVGGDYACGLTMTGAIYCWGDNPYGQLGDSSTTSRPAPVPVAGGLTFSALNAGRFHACGLTAGGAAYCWGFNPRGELGDGTTIGRLAPTAVSGGLTFVALAGGQYHTCGLTTTGAAYCWGWNEDGELGNGSYTTSTVPVAVSGGLSFSSVTGGYAHSCGVDTTGTVYCWGWNSFAQLGDGSGQSSPVPVQVAAQP